MTYTTAARANAGREKPEDIDVPTVEEEDELIERILEDVDQVVREESEAEDDEWEEKGVRYVRTPEGAARYGQPIGTPIVADAVGNPISNPVGDVPEFETPAILEGRPAPVTPTGRPKFSWRESNWSEAGVLHYGNYRGRVERFPEGGPNKWRIETITQGGMAMIIADGVAKNHDLAKKAVERALKKRIDEYQARTDRDYDNFFDYYEGVEGLDFWSDGREVTAEDEEVFDIPVERYNLALDNLKKMGIDLQLVGTNEEPLDVNVLEMVAFTMRAYEDMFPGFIESIMHVFGSGYHEDDRNTSALAYNGINFQSIRDGSMKTEMVLNPRLFGEDRDTYAIDELGDFTSSWWAIDYEAMEQKHSDVFHTFQLKMMSTLNHEMGHSFGRVAMGELAKPGYDMGGAQAHFQAGFYDILWNWGFVSDDDTEEGVSRMVSAERSRKENGVPIIGIDANLITEVLSRYGATSFHEMIAEAWSEYILDPNPRQFSVELGNLLDETMRLFLDSKGTV